MTIPQVMLSRQRQSSTGENDDRTTTQQRQSLQETLEQHLIHELYASVRLLVKTYGSQNATARALGISSPTLTRASPGWLAKNAAHDRLPRPQLATLLTFSKCEIEPIRQAAIALLARRGHK
jgi:hypothetical protein